MSEIEPVEYVIPLVKELERLGHRINTCHFDLQSPDDEDFLIIQKCYPDANVTEIDAAKKQAISREYIRPASMGPNPRYKLTSNGVAAARSRIERDKIRQQTTKLKRTSNWIDSHNGLATLAAGLIGLAGLIVAIFGLF